MTGWIVLLTFGVVAVVLCTLYDHDRIDDQRYVAEQRRRWKNHEPTHTTPAGRVLNAWDCLTRWLR